MSGKMEKFEYTLTWYPEVAEFVETCENIAVLFMILGGVKRDQASVYETSESDKECVEMIETIQTRINDLEKIA